MSRVVGYLRRVALLQEADRLTDAQLLESFLVGQEEAAFEALVRRHGPMILGVCRRVLHDPHDAEDAFQATFLVLLRKAAGIGKRELLANWLYGVAHRTALQARKSTARRRAKERQVEAMAQKQVTADDAIRDMLPLLDKELSRLPDKYRVPIILCDLEGKTRKNAAQQLGLPEATLSMRLDRARVMLGNRLARHGKTLSGSAVALAVTQSMASASVPHSLVASTVKSVSLIVAGKTGVAAAISAKVAALTEGVVRTMLLTKLKVLAVVLCVAATGTIGGGLLAQRTVNSFIDTVEKTRSGLPAQAKNDTLEKNAQTDAELPVRKLGMPVSLEGHRQPVICLAFSPDGRTLASGGQYGPEPAHALILWDIASGKPTQFFTGFKSNVYAVAFSKDGKTLASGHYNGTIHVWDVKTATMIRTLNGNKEPVFSLAYSPNGKILAAGRRDFTIDLWNAATSANEATLTGHNGSVLSIAFSPDGKTLASGSSDTAVKLWDMATRWERITLRGHAAQVWSIAYSPDGKSLVSTAGKTIKVWDVGTGSIQHTLDGHDSVHSVVFRPDSTMLAWGQNDGTIRLWDTTTYSELLTLNGHKGTVNCLAFSPNGKLFASGSHDSTVKLWDIPPAQETPDLKPADRQKTKAQPRIKKRSAFLYLDGVEAVDVANGAVIGKELLPGFLGDQFGDKWQITVKPTTKIDYDGKCIALADLRPLIEAGYPQFFVQWEPEGAVDRSKPQATKKGIAIRIETRRQESWRRLSL